MLSRFPPTVVMSSESLPNGAINNPFEEALEDWVLGSEAFLAKLVSLAKPTKRTPKPLKRKSQLSPEQIIAFVAEQNGELPESYQGSRATVPGRELAALLCRELTTKSLAELSRAFGLGPAKSRLTNLGLHFSLARSHFPYFHGCSIYFGDRGPLLWLG